MGTPTRGTTKRFFESCVFLKKYISTCTSNITKLLSRKRKKRQTRKRERFDIGIGVECLRAVRRDSLTCACAKTTDSDEKKKKTEWRGVTHRARAAWRCRRYRERVPTAVPAPEEPLVPCSRSAGLTAPSTAMLATCISRTFTGTVRVYLRNKRKFNFPWRESRRSNHSILYQLLCLLNVAATVHDKFTEITQSVTSSKIILLLERSL